MQDEEIKLEAIGIVSQEAIADFLHKQAKLRSLENDLVGILIDCASEIANFED